MDHKDTVFFQRKQAVLFDFSAEELKFRWGNTIAGKTRVQTLSN